MLMTVMLNSNSASEVSEMTWCYPFWTAHVKPGVLEALAQMKGKPFQTISAGKKKPIETLTQSKLNKIMARMDNWAVFMWLSCLWKWYIMFKRQYIIAIAVCLKVVVLDADCV